MWISKIYWTWSPHNCLVYILCTITNCAVHFKPRGVTWGEDYCVLQCTLKTWFHPISFSKKMQSHENSSELLSEILSQVELHHDRCFGTLWNPTPPKKFLVMLLLCTIRNTLFSSCQICLSLLSLVISFSFFSCNER